MNQYLIILCFIMVIPQAWAQPENPNNPKDFFDNNFVLEDAAEIPPSDKLPSSSKETPNETLPTDLETAVSPFTTDFDLVSDEDLRRRYDFQPLPIKSLSAAFNSRPHKFAIKHMQHLVGLAKSLALPISTVYIVGDSRELDLHGAGDLMFWFWALGGVIKYGDEELQSLKLTYLPVWFIELESGVVVLEGFESPTKFISQKGLYVQP